MSYGVGSRIMKSRRSCVVLILTFSCGVNIYSRDFSKNRQKQNWMIDLNQKDESKHNWSSTVNVSQIMGLDQRHEVMKWQDYNCKQKVSLTVRNAFPFLAFILFLFYGGACATRCVSSGTGWWRLTAILVYYCQVGWNLKLMLKMLMF